MKLLITGASGFIGQSLKKREACIPIPRRALGNKELLQDIFEIHPYPVVNLASYGNYYDQTDREEMWNVNVEYVKNILDVLPHNRKFINFSSSSVLLQKKTRYAITKEVAEYMVDLKRDQGFQCMSVRPSSVTGVGEQKHHLIPTLIRSCLTGDEMPFVEWPTHDFIDVDDLIDGLMLVIEKGTGDYNLSRNKTYTNKEVRHIVEWVTDHKANVNITDSLRSYDNDNWQIDNTELVKLGWEPKTELSQTIINMVEQAKKELG